MHSTGPLSPSDPVIRNSYSKFWRRLAIVLGIGAITAALSMTLILTGPSAAVGKSAQSTLIGLVLSSGYRIEKYLIR